MHWRLEMGGWTFFDYRYQWIDPYIIASRTLNPPPHRVHSASINDLDLLTHCWLLLMQPVCTCVYMCWKREGKGGCHTIVCMYVRFRSEKPRVCVRISKSNCLDATKCIVLMFFQLTSQDLVFSFFWEPGIRYVDHEQSNTVFLFSYIVYHPLAPCTYPTLYRNIYQI